MHLETPDYTHEDRTLPMLSVSASRKQEGSLFLSIVNIDPRQASELTIDLRGMEAGSVKGRILTADKMNSHNTFEQPDKVQPEDFDAGNFKQGFLTARIPAKSIVVLEVESQ